MSVQDVEVVILFFTATRVLPLLFRPTIRVLLLLMCWFVTGGEKGKEENSLREGGGVPACQNRMWMYYYRRITLPSFLCVFLREGGDAGGAGQVWGRGNAAPAS